MIEPARLSSWFNCKTICNTRFHAHRRKFPTPGFYSRFEHPSRDFVLVTGNVTGFGQFWSCFICHTNSRLSDTICKLSVFMTLKFSPVWAYNPTMEVLTNFRPRPGCYMGLAREAKYLPTHSTSGRQKMFASGDPTQSDQPLNLSQSGRSLRLDLRE